MGDSAPTPHLSPLECTRQRPGGLGVGGEVQFFGCTKIWRHAAHGLQCAFAVVNRLDGSGPFPWATIVTVEGGCGGGRVRGKKRRFSTAANQVQGDSGSKYSHSLSFLSIDGGTVDNRAKEKQQQTCRP